MRKSIRAGVLLLMTAFAVAGCATSDMGGLLTVQTTPGGEKLIAGSVETVAQSTHRSLQQIGLAAELTQKGEEFYITGKTSTGSKYNLVLTRDKSNPAQQTHVKLEWEGGKDDRLGSLILAQVEFFATSK